MLDKTSNEICEKLRVDNGGKKKKEKTFYSSNADSLSIVE